MVTNAYGNGEIAIGVANDLRGVQLWGRHPETGEPILIWILEPAFARQIAEQITINSFECEDERGKYRGRGPNGKP